MIIVHAYRLGVQLRYPRIVRYYKQVLSGEGHRKYCELLMSGSVRLSMCGTVRGIAIGESMVYYVDVRRTKFGRTERRCPEIIVTRYVPHEWEEFKEYVFG